MASQTSSPILLVALLCVSSLMLQGAAAAYYDIREFAEVFSPMGPRQSSAPSNLGEVFAYNNDLKEGDDQGALVGFVNGDCLVSAEITDGIPNTAYECAETLVFTGGQYAGSSLTVVGYYDFVANNPLAIVGGTGLFRGASGELNYVLPSNAHGYSIPTLAFVTPDFPTPTPTPTSTSAPTTCNPGSNTPNQCFSADGSSFVCCPGSCGSNATCA